MAMLGLAHLASSRLYTTAFMKLYTNKPCDSSMRQPSREEAEHADKHVWTMACNLVNEGWNWNQALYEVVQIRESMVTHLQPRLKAILNVQLDKHKKPRLGGNHSNSNYQRDHKNPNFRPTNDSNYYKGKGRGKGKHFSKSGQSKGNQHSNNQSSSSNTAQQTQGVCFRFQQGQCKAQSCRFKHVCSRCNAEGHGSVNCTA